jgi:dynein heavy chain 2, cytosolic
VDERARAPLQAWLKDAGLPSYDLCRFMSSESEMLTWKAQGLPADVLSLQNAVVIINCTLTPLIIDPSLQVGVPGCMGGT